MKRVAVVVAAALALAGCSLGGAPRNTAGEVTQSASVNAFQLRVGDCTGSLAEGDIEDLQVIPCEESHFYEAYAARDLPDGEFPGENEVTEQADKYCTTEFKTFVGLPTKDSKYEMFYLYPVDESWQAGDREVMCLVGSSKGKITGSLQGVAK